MVGIRYGSLNDLNGQATAWCNKVNGKIHGTTGEIPFERIKKERLNPLKREYIIDKINLRRVVKAASSIMPPISIPCPRNTPDEMWQSWHWITYSPPITKVSKLLSIKYPIKNKTCFAGLFDFCTFLRPPLSARVSLRFRRFLRTYYTIIPSQMLDATVM